MMLIKSAIAEKVVYELLVMFFGVSITTSPLFWSSALSCFEATHNR